jgi:hypothetical protein
MAACDLAVGLGREGAELTVCAHKHVIRRSPATAIHRRIAHNILGISCSSCAPLSSLMSLTRGSTLDQSLSATCENYVSECRVSSTRPLAMAILAHGEVMGVAIETLVEPVATA